ncbi:MAG TPA: GGDEF domain-containing protein [Vicinamibacterales bacterium]|nr:GGDEF domain-containing protein [Vicinamibacterales bacterium]
MPLSVRTAGAIALVAGLGVLDAVVSPRLPFSILYFLPVMAAAWFGNRAHGFVVAVAAIGARAGADVGWNGFDQLTAMQLVTWGAALVAASALTAWAHSRREDVNALKDRINELLQIERSFARTDPLTSLCNRRAFVDALQGAEARGRRTGERLAVARLDIDGFKTLNDAYSRNEGDQLLRAVATSLSLTTRMGDLAARLENDEFALLLYSCSPDNAQKIGRRVVDEVAELGRAYPNARVTASVGLACFTAPGPDPDEMMRLAGGALRQARQTGGNAVIVEMAEAARAVSAVSEPRHL